MNSKVPVLVVALSIALMPAAHADEQRVSDPDDVSAPLDLASASHGHGNTTSMLVHRMETYEPWTNEEFRGARIRFWLRDADPDYDRILTVTSDPDGSLTAGMTSLDSPATPFRGYANAYRTSDRGFHVSIPARLIARGLRVYRWKAYIAYDDCADSEAPRTCSGYDSHVGRVRHRTR